MLESDMFRLVYILQQLLGGTVYLDYNAKDVTYSCKIKNDDIGEMEWVILEDCMKYESFTTRVNRMCEEYDGYMRYKYRDYVKELE